MEVTPSGTTGILSITIDDETLEVSSRSQDVSGYINETLFQWSDHLTDLQAIIANKRDDEVAMDNFKFNLAINGYEGGISDYRQLTFSDES